MMNLNIVIKESTADREFNFPKIAEGTVDSGLRAPCVYQDGDAHPGAGYQFQTIIRHKFVATETITKAYYCACYNIMESHIRGSGISPCTQTIIILSIHTYVTHTGGRRRPGRNICAE